MRRWLRSRRVGASDHLLGLVLAAAYFFTLLGASANLGMARDEGFYVIAAERYAGWFRQLAEDPSAAMTAEAIDQAWSYNHEHPALAKSFFAFGYLLQEATGIFPQQSMSYRAFGMLSGGLLLWLIYIFGARLYGRRAGLFAAFAFALMPRVFYHSQLDCFDVPIVLMLTLVTYCYYRSLTSYLWALLTGLAYGLALATKHNAWILPGVLMVHWVWTLVGELYTGRPGKLGQIKRFPWWLLAMLLLGPPIFVGSWPWLWHDTAPRFGEYAGFHLNHVHYNMAYFGVNYFRPPLPISYPWVMTLYTVPLTILAFALGGLLSRARTLLPRGWARWLWPGSRVSAPRLRPEVLLFGSMMAPLVVISMPWTPIFGGTKHWITAYPFLAIFAGVGFARLSDVIEEGLLGWLRTRDQARDALAPSEEVRPPPGRELLLGGAVALSGLLALGPGLLETAHSHPFGLSHYTYAAGGTPGAASDGMNRQFWGFTTGSLVDYFNEHLPEGGTVWICDTVGTAWDMLQRDGRLDPRIRATGSLTTADFAIVHHEHHFAEVDFQIWEAFGSVRPAYVLTHDGVPIISVYKNPGSRSAR